MSEPTSIPAPEIEGDLHHTVSKLLSTIIRRRWWIILPAATVILGTVLVLSYMSNRYTSEATLLVVQQQVPERYVVSTTNRDINEALQAATQEILSRTRLLEIIDEFGLYTKMRKRISPEELLGTMRRDIAVTPIENLTARSNLNGFTISFKAESPHLAQAVTNKLTSLFIEQNLENREHQATTTTNFLQDQLEAAKRKLEQAEEVVRQYKMQNLGALPEQEQGNVTILGGLQTQLQNTMSALSRSREQRQYLESLGENRAMIIQGDLTRLKAEREDLLRKYTPKYPALRAVDIKIAQKEALLKTVGVSGNTAAEVAPGEDRSNSSIGVAEDASVAQINGQLQANRLELEDLSREETRLKAAIAQYQNRLNQTPVREQQLAGILRNYELLKKDYADLLDKKMQSELAQNLEKRQQGQQFRLVDSPSLPTVPSSPKRVKICAGGAAAGLFLGLLLAFVADTRDRSFHSEEDLARELELGLAFVVGVPILRTPAEQNAHRRRRVLEWTIGSALVLAMFVGEFYQLYRYR